MAFTWNISMHQVNKEDVMVKVFTCYAFYSPDLFSFFCEAKGENEKSQ